MAKFINKLQMILFLFLKIIILYLAKLKINKFGFAFYKNYGQKKIHHIKK